MACKFSRFTTIFNNFDSTISKDIFKSLLKISKEQCIDFQGKISYFSPKIQIHVENFGFFMNISELLLQKGIQLDSYASKITIKILVEYPSQFSCHLYFSNAY